VGLEIVGALTVSEKTSYLPAKHVLDRRGKN
jgi:hypothetical protein